MAVFAGDHGVHAKAVTPWPQEVTAQMVANFLAGGAVVNAFAREARAAVTVVDVAVAAALAPADGLVVAKVRPGTGDITTGPALTRDEAAGVAADLDPVPGLLPRKIGRGTADFTAGPAMSRDQATAAITAGAEIARDLVAAGNRCLVTGDMGIANTTPAAALIAAFTGAPADRVTGRGTGIDDAMLAHKTSVVAAALERHRPDRGDPLGVLATVGGGEHAAIAGFILGAAARRVPVVVDGVIAVSGALAAAAFAPDAAGAMIAGHRSAEPGASVALAHLGLTPLVDLGLRLGEGTGAVLALPIVASAVRVLHEVATFDSAGVSEK